jgi:hypothetical protein
VRKLPVTFTKAIETEQLRLLSEAESLGTDSPDYKTKIEFIKSLNETKSKKDNNAIIAALISAGASVAGILLVLNYERAGAVVSKSFGLVKKA